MDKIIKTKKAITGFVACFGVLLAVLLFNYTSSPVKALAKENNPVQLVSGHSVTEIHKPVPEKYNGQTRKIAYLTFDDGPGKLTGELLKTLKSHDVKATFFLIGANVKQYPDLVKQQQSEGHYVGMHSMTHSYKKLYTGGEFVNEMLEDQGLIANTIGNKPVLTRPPYGSMPGLNEPLRNKVAEAGLKVWDWTIDSLDWRYSKIPVDTASAKIVHNVISGATKQVEVILLHDIHKQSVAAVPAIIKGLKDKGYEFEAYHESSHFPVNFWHDNRI
ncbi:peptidoglycan-N-acetylglucosamine deacetylase [Bacillus bombysepticus]|uniref:peptidoglycan-N-acetylglucosamine deacetylase n=1 Tax=Bacillus bombysepticus TaxID=658666 RepID=UPI00301A3C66